MSNPSTAKWTLGLAVVACALTLLAAVVLYFKSGEFRWGIVGAGMFVLMIGLSAWSKAKKESKEPN
jgi:hypothetical protein